jgi:photosystem II stability/assembly factor-like uncharacterized protein
MPRWVDTGGPSGQDVTALLIDERSPGTLFAGHTSGTISRSTDDGRSWAVVSTLSGLPAILELVHHPDLPQSMFAATSLGLYTTTDGGTTWSPTSVDAGSPATPCGAFTIDPFDPNQMYAGLTGLGLYRSSDGGHHWKLCDVGAPPDNVRQAEFLSIVISPVDPNLIVAALSHVGVVKSTDRGGSWSMLTRELAASGTVPTTLVLHPRQKDAICFGTRAGDVYRTVNGGVTWSPTRQGTDETPVGSLIAAASEPDRLLATCGAGMMESRDFGTTWKELATGLPRIPSSLVTTHARGAMVMFVYGKGMGVQRSQDEGQTWQAADRGLGGSTVTGLAIRPHTGDVYAVTGSAIHLFSRASSSWISTSSGLRGAAVSSVAFDVEPDSLVYAGTRAGIFRSADGGASWSPLPRTFGPYPVQFFDAHLSIRTRMIAGTSAGLYVSTDRGFTWKPSNPQGEKYDVRAITYCMDNAGIMHAATRDRGIVGSGDGGLSWESNRYGIASGDILGITRDRGNDRLMYCWTSSGEGYRSTNRGMEWDRYASPWNTGDRVVLWVAKDAPHLAMALVNRRQVFSTTSAGATWKTLLVEELPVDVEAITWSSRDAALYAGTRGRGVYRITLPESLAPETR